MATFLIERAMFVDNFPTIGNIFNILTHLTVVSSDPFMTAVALTSLFIPYMNFEEDVSTVDYLWGTLF